MGVTIGRWAMGGTCCVHTIHRRTFAYRRRSLGAVRRAVDEFARRERVIVTLSYGEPIYTTSSWMIRKPFDRF